MFVFRKNIPSTSVIKKTSHRATSTRYIPCRTTFQLADNRQRDRRKHSTMLEPLITAVYFSKKTISFWSCAEQQSIKTHPFSTSQSGSFHIISTFNNGNIQLLNTPVTTTIFKRRKQNGIRMQVDNLFHIRIHAVTAIDNSSPFNAFLHDWQFDIFQVADTTDTVESSQIVHQSAMYRRIDYCFGKRGTHHRTLRQMCG